MFKLRILFFALMVSSVMMAQDNQMLFKDANEAFAQKEYNKAIEKYEQILAFGVQSPEVHYNLGNAFFQTGQRGKAILHYERGLRLDNADEDLRHNLKVARNTLVDEIETLEPFFLNRWWNNIRNLASATGWSVIALLIFWLGITGLVVWQLSTVRKQKKIGFVAGIVLLFLSILPFSLAVDSARNEKDSQRAVIMLEEVDLRSGPDIESTSIVALHEGTSVELLDQIGEWYKVKLKNGEQGWIKTNELEKI